MTMKVKLKDIIDLDYLLTLDERNTSGENNTSSEQNSSGNQIQSRSKNDREIYQQIKPIPKSEKDLFLSWLAIRKETFLNQKDKNGLGLLPGTVFATLYTYMIYAMILVGGFTGITLAYSFLAYHGSRPINVAVFIALFVVLQVVFIGFTLIYLIRRNRNFKKQNSDNQDGIIQTLVSGMFFNLLPRLLKKADWSLFKKGLDSIEYMSALIRMKNREYKDLFFWPMFGLTGLFSLSLSIGALGGTFFRVVVSDMAFGWQSTLMTSSEKIFEILSLMAMPWSWFISETIAHPSLSQIEGSRIILKDGISVLATQDLISWWPFICLRILFYVVMPRILLSITGVVAQKKTLKTYRFTKPLFRQLQARMTSPVVDIESKETPVSLVAKENPIKHQVDVPENHDGKFLKDQNVVLLIRSAVYNENKVEQVKENIKNHLHFKIEKVLDIQFDIDKDTSMLQQIDFDQTDGVILIQEVWQPPIRGVQFYITQIKKLIPEGKFLWIYLTQDAGQENLVVSENDVNFITWEKTIFKFEDPDMIVKRFIKI